MKNEFWVAQNPKIEISKNIEVFQKSIWLMTRMTGISEKIWISFPGFSNKG